MLKVDRLDRLCEGIRTGKHHIYTMPTIKFTLDDGGRAVAGMAPATGGCVPRALAIATGLPYAQAYAICSVSQLITRGRAGASRGVRTSAPTFQAIITGMGWTYTKLGVVDYEQLPLVGRVIVHFEGHYSALVAGVCRDTWNPYDGKHPLLGYWSRA